jgi:hypothetical protein
MSLQVDHYMAPTAEGARYARYPTSSDIGHMLSGRPNLLRLETPEVRLVVECKNSGYTSLSFGPYLLPIIPFPVDWKRMKTDPLRIDVRFAPVDAPLDFDPGKTEVVDSTGRRLQLGEIHCGQWHESARYGDPEQAVSAGSTVRISEPMAFRLVFGVATEPEERSFTLNLHGLSRSGKDISLQPIRLEASSGLEAYVFP